MKQDSIISTIELGTEQFGLQLKRQSYSSSGEEGHERTDGNHKRVWKETWFRLSPISGLLALVLTILSTIASLGILVGSNYSPIYKWTAPPSTYIAIFTAVANLSIRYATVQGVIVAWWIGALRGSSLQQLHLRWHSGTSIRGAIACGRNMGWLGLACIFSTLVSIDGPLFQRASTIMQLTYKHPVSLSRSMVPQLPNGYTGSWALEKYADPGVGWSYSFNKTVPTPHGRAPNNVYLNNKLRGFYDTINLWFADAGYSGIVRGCPGECTGTLIAPAVAATSCTTHTIAADYRHLWSFEDAREWNDHAPPLATLMFSISTELVVDEQQEKINAVTGFSSNHDCNGTFQYTICTLESAIGEYDITIHDNKTTLDSAANPRILDIVKNPPIHETLHEAGEYHNSTLAGVASIMWSRWDSYYNMANVSGAMASSDLANAAYGFAVQTSSVCPNFTDPRSEYMASMNKLMVYFGMVATEGIRDKHIMNTLDPRFDINTVITGYAHGTISVYHTDYAYLIGALILEALCVCLILPTYWGWSKLGRSVSFSPLEIAKAFDAPMFADLNSQSSGRDIAKAFKDRPVQYGAVYSDEKNDKVKLVFSDQSRVARPRQGCSFDV